MALLVAVVLGSGVVAASAQELPPKAAAASTSSATLIPAYRPERLTHLGDARAVVVVTTASWSSTWAAVRVFTLSSTGWRQRLPAVWGRVGYRGLVPGTQRIQNDGKTPTGTFGLKYAFGWRPNPGTTMWYRPVTITSWWPNDPADPQTYNIWQTRRPPTATWRRAWAEKLSDWLPQYDYGVVLDYNLPPEPYVARFAETVTNTPANTRRGGGIFLHVSSTGPTDGCVSVPAYYLVATLKLLRPADHPVIVIGPLSSIDLM